MYVRERTYVSISEVRRWHPLVRLALSQMKVLNVRKQLKKNVSLMERLVARPLVNKGLNLKLPRRGNEVLLGGYMHNNNIMYVCWVSTCSLLYLKPLMIHLEVTW